jgi:hypothetical protein
MRKMLSTRGWLAALLGVAGLASVAGAQCPQYTISAGTGGTITPGVTDIGNHVDDGVTNAVPLPFGFNFYGTTYNAFNASSNGNIQFLTSAVAYTNVCPQANQGTFGPAIFAFWDDLYTLTTGAGQGIFTTSSGVSPSQRFYIEYRTQFCCVTTAPVVNFEIVLKEEGGFDIIYHTNGDPRVAGNSATIGTQDGTGNIQSFNCNTANLTDGEVLSFTCPPSATPRCSLSVSPGTVAVGDPFVVRATVIEGSPAFPPYTVAADASAVNAGSVILYDDGPGGGHGDLTAGDLVFTNSVTVGAGTTNGNKLITSLVTDSSPTPLSSSCSAQLIVNTVPLAGTGSATPATNVPLGNASVLAVLVTPATGPVSTGILVTADLTSIGGSATQQFYDDATHGDVTAGDYRYTFSATVGGAAGVYSMPFSVSDTQGRSASGNIAIGTYDPNATWEETANGGGDTGSTPGTAQTVNRPQPVSQIRGTVAAGNDADMYLIHICDPANFSATTVGGATYDTQLWLFTTDGHGIVMDDDEGVQGSTVLQSRLTNMFTSTLPPGDYVLGMTGYNQDARDVSNALIFNNTETACFGSTFRCEHGPDGPGGANVIDHWDTGSANTGPYTIFLTGVSGSVCAPPCGSADFNCDGDTGTDADIEAFFTCLAGTCPAAPCPNNADFNGDGDTGTDADIEAFFRVLAGGHC